jgi:hypothetical protein
VLNARDWDEANDVCEELRAAGIKCGALEVPNTNSATAWATSWLRPSLELKVFVDAPDIDRAREVLADRLRLPGPDE